MDERKMIYLEDAIKAVCDEFITVYCYNCANQGSEDQCEDCHRKSMGWSVSRDTVERILNNLPSAQPEPAIPLSWIEGQIEWLKSLGNDFSALTAGQISAMINKWKDEQDESN